MRYGLMLRGVAMWDKVPREGRVALEPLCALADEFLAEALIAQPQAIALWNNRIVAQVHTHGNWMETFESAVALHPQAQSLYETAMEYSQQRWGGTEARRKLVEELAKKNNPGQPWTLMLRERALWKRDRQEA